MAADALTIAVSQLDPTQVTKASTALLKHIASNEQKALEAPKKSLLADEDGDEEEAEESTPIWLVLTTKKHIVDKNRLKPAKIPIPHSLHSDSTERIILITAEPQRAYKDLIAHPSFPSALSSKISRVIDIGKLKAKYKSYEAKRQLVAEHDVFLADERIIPFLPAIMGKVLYKTGAKRPIPVSLTGKEKHEKLPENKRRPKDTPRLVGSAADVARDIEKALNSALVNLSPSVSTAVKVGYANFTAEQLKENVEALVPSLIEKLVPKKWNNVKSIHIKGPETAALPIYMSEELWVDEGDVLDQPHVQKPRGPRKVRGAKRPLLENGKADEEEKASTEKPSKKEKKRKADEGDDLDKEIAVRKAKLKKQKAEAMGKNASEL